MRALRLTAGCQDTQNEAALQTFVFQLCAVGLERHVRQHPFAAEALGREWRFDVAFLPERLGIEINGGIWTKGAHGHPVTIIRNMEKLNHAAALGWRVLSFSTTQAKSGQALQWTEAVIKHTRGVLCHVEFSRLLTTFRSDPPSRRRSRRAGAAPRSASS